MCKPANNTYSEPEYAASLARAEALEREITDLCAQINAANYRLLQLIVALDNEKPWGAWGVSPHIASISYCGRRKAHCGEPYSRRPAKRSIQLRRRGPLVRAARHSVFATPSLRKPIRYAGCHPAHTGSTGAAASD